MQRLRILEHMRIMFDPVSSERIDTTDVEPACSIVGSGRAFPCTLKEAWDIPPADLPVVVLVLVLGRDLAPHAALRPTEDGTVQSLDGLRGVARHANAIDASIVQDFECLWVECMRAVTIEI